MLMPILFIIAFCIVFIIIFRLQNDLKWISESLFSEEKLKNIKKEADAYEFILDKISQGLIKQGMNFEELNKVLSTLEGQFQIFNNLGMVQSETGCDNWYHGYGRGIPTPILHLVVKKGKLVTCKITRFFY